MTDGERVSVKISEVAKWRSIIGDGAGSGAMEMSHENRLCRLELQIGEKPPTTGLAYNERCLGTLW